MASWPASCGGPPRTCRSDSPGGRPTSPWRERTKVKELRRFVRTIVQAEDSGLALRDVLSSQAAEMRLVRRQRAEEKAMKIPVKVIFPLIFCILPVLFIVILGPAALSIMKAFGM